MSNVGIVIIAFGFVILAVCVCFLLAEVIKVRNMVRSMKFSNAERFNKIFSMIEEHKVDAVSAYHSVCERLEEGFESIETLIEHGEYDVELEVDEDLIEDDIHLISREEYHLSNIGYEHCALKYYPNSDRLEYRADLDPEPFVVGNVEELIGDGLKYFGVRSSDEDAVYVRNHRFKVDFKIERMV